VAWPNGRVIALVFREAEVVPDVGPEGFGHPLGDPTGGVSPDRSPVLQGRHLIAVCVEDSVGDGHYGSHHWVLPNRVNVDVDDSHGLYVGSHHVSRSRHQPATTQCSVSAWSLSACSCTNSAPVLASAMSSSVPGPSTPRPAPAHNCGARRQTPDGGHLPRHRLSSRMRQSRNLVKGRLVGVPFS
jgi:hypothetical protein